MEGMKDSGIIIAPMTPKPVGWWRFGKSQGTYYQIAMYYRPKWLVRWSFKTFFDAEWIDE